MSVKGGTSATDLRSRVPDSRSLPLGVWRPNPTTKNTCSPLASRRSPSRPLALASPSPSQSPPKKENGDGKQVQLPGPQGVSAMDLFPEGALVRLQSRAQWTYLHADEDGEGVSLRPHGHGRAFSLNKVWRVQRVEVDGAAFVLLQGAAYGRYLAVSPAAAPPCCIGHRAVQHDYDEPDVGNLMWRPFRKVDGGRYVRLRHGANQSLRANGRSATVDTNQGRWSTMMQWTVSRFDLAPGLPPLPLPTVFLGARSGLFRRRRPEADQQRTIRHVRANDEGDFDQDNWLTFPFYGRSVFNLRFQVGMRQPGGEVGGGITMAVRPGFHGRLTPLVTDLPRSVGTMDIVVFNTGSQGAQNFVYPNI